MKKAPRVRGLLGACETANHDLEAPSLHHSSVIVKRYFLPGLKKLAAG
jgi:hypothetical protein